MMASRGIAFGDMKCGQGRIYVETGDARAPMAISRVPGVISCSPAISVGTTVEEAAAFAADVAASIAAKKIGPTATQGYESFRKYVPEEIGRVNRGAVFDAVTRRKPHADLGGAKWRVHVELGSAGAYVFTDIVPGVGRTKPLQN